MKYFVLFCIQDYKLRNQVCLDLVLYKKDYRHAKDDAQCVCIGVVDIKCALEDIEMDDFCIDGENYADDNKDENFTGISLILKKQGRLPPGVNKYRKINVQSLMNNQQHNKGKKEVKRPYYNWFSLYYNHKRYLLTSGFFQYNIINGLT